MLTLFIGYIYGMAVLLVVLLVQLERAFRRFRIKKFYSAAIEAPSVSVCIPARNETHAMTQSLERVLASDYAKLEVIVYDDGSVDNTSVLIKSFAHAGVRFVAGTPLPDGWLGRNHALDVLLREASGTYVVFMDVDTHISPTTISQLVGYMTSEQLEMASVIPAKLVGHRPAALFRPLRYFLRMVSLGGRPVASSSFWIARRQELLGRWDGFATFREHVEPEVALADAFGIKQYHTLLGNESLGVSTDKRWQSEIESSRRIIYPNLGGVWWRGLAALCGFVLVCLPAAMVPTALLFGWSYIHTVCLLLVLGYVLLYGLYAYRMLGRFWWIAALTWPYVITQEMYLLLSSMVGYIRGTITWKGRPIRRTASSSDI